MASKRLCKEFDILSDKYDIEVVGGRPPVLEWQLALFGPDDSPYFGGTYLLNISIPEEYPFKPPEIKFVTKIYHPNINHKGEICLEILTDEWKPSNTILNVMEEISKLLSNPNPDDPMAPEITKVFLKDRELFNKTANEWVEKYAM
jgi:ubiquitin-conjugating enzyme E2 D/E